MKKTQPHSTDVPEENIVREAEVHDSFAAGKTAEPIPADEAKLEGPTAEELADPTLIYQENLAVREQELAELSEKYLRLAAEYDNFRRRTQKEKESLYTDSITAVVKEWLPVLDSLDRAVQTVATVQNEDVKPVAEGIELIRKQAVEAMGRLNVSEIECLGKTFDPNLSEAVMHIEDDAVDASTVVEVFQKGYSRGDRVIRHSLVKVAN